MNVLRSIWWFSVALLASKQCHDFGATILLTSFLNFLSAQCKPAALTTQLELSVA